MTDSDSPRKGPLPSPTGNRVVSLLEEQNRLLRENNTYLADVKGLLESRIVTVSKGGYKSGRAEGKGKGYDQGSRDGTKAGEKKGYHKGRDEGFDAGKGKGKEKGVLEGYRQAMADWVAGTARERSPRRED